ncbi:MAG: ATP-binding cassette domain-containing protein [Pirellulales bacterium]|nr:ATP-binding cassette domain-containing protein [Pirellulales bacterium]
MIVVEKLHLRVGEFELRELDFAVPQGEYAVCMGRTGSGKTTLVEALCGLRPIAAGRILLLGEDVTHRKPAERGIGYVPQDGALFDTMTVGDHLAFSLVVRRWRRAEIDARVAELASTLGISHLLARFPPGLSGGERQRVALGRALAFRPGILCLDEPLSALDEQTREEMHHLLKSVQRQTGVTALHVTHSREETTALADCVLQITAGKLTSYTRAEWECD